MLKIWYYANIDYMKDAPSYFDNVYEDEWIEDAFVKEMIQDVDHCVVISPHIIDSPVLGAITPRELSGGVKVLILGVNDENVLDFRFVHYLKMYGANKDVYGMCRFVQKTYLQSIGPLIGEDVVAARLGIDRDCDDFKELMKLLEPYKYKGILSTSYERWWSEEILKWWNREFDGKFLRLMPAKQRVQALNSKFNLHLRSVNPLEFNRSTCYWSICNELKRPIDPNEGYMILNDKIYPWQEREYYSFKSLLSNDKLMKKISSADRKKIVEYGQEIEEEQE